MLESNFEHFTNLYRIDVFGIFIFKKNIKLQQNWQYSAQEIAVHLHSNNVINIVRL